ncbi:MAG: MGH1-like glycoside hydrolase domain-containing protein [Blastocatellia bacterium]
MKPRSTPLMLMLASVFVAATNAFPQTPLPAKFPLQSNPIEIARAARPNVYFDAVGRKAALFGHESGVFESWAFPIKLFHDARMSIRVEGQDDPVDFASNVERIIARPEATTLVASNQIFTIRATFFSPIDEAGSIVLLDVDAARPLVITVSFTPDLKPMWPAGLGGQSARWDDELKAFVISESRHKFNGFFGSPAATRGVATPAHQLASVALRFDIKVDPKTAKQSFYPLIIAGGINGREPVIELYQRLAGSIAVQYQKTFNHYRRLREEMLKIESPEEPLNLAVEWAKVALDKGMVENPALGLGLVAGWGATGNGARPGFGWFFGGDAAINSYAMTGYGDFDSTRAAFRLLAKHQRADGKIPHEISQSAAMINWFEEYTYAYSHAETTPFYIAAVYNLYRQSGDKKFIEELWPALKKAYEFCVANDSDGDGILENPKAGLGASELGTLLDDLHQDIYLAATNLEASLAMREMAGVMGDKTLREQADQKFQRANVSIKELYWDQQAGRYAYALTRSGKLNPEITAWTAVPMAFGHFDPKRASETLASLSSAQISTDWGARMLGAASTAYNPTAYNNGGVWPFLTGFVACAEYEYRRPHSGFAHLSQLVNLTFDHALGSHHEILSGDFYRPLDESVPHQLFSSGMVVTPLVRGLLGLRPDAAGRSLRFAPQIPAAWDSLRVSNYRIGSSRLSFNFKRAAVSTLQFELAKEDDEPLKVQFAPALPALARIGKVTIDRKTVKPSPCVMSGAGTVCNFEFQLRRRSVIEIALKSGIEIDVPRTPVELGERTSSLKVLEVTTPGPNRLGLRLEGLAGRGYVIRARGASVVQDALYGVIKGEVNGWKLIEVVIPTVGDNTTYQRRDIEIRMRDGGKRK